jgi:hypothetical protein
MGVGEGLQSRSSLRTRCGVKLQYEKLARPDRSRRLSMRIEERRQGLESFLDFAQDISRLIFDNAKIRSSIPKCEILHDSFHNIVRFRDGFGPLANNFDSTRLSIRARCAEFKDI